jgi:hypothetical protein
MSISAMLLLGSLSLSSTRAHRRALLAFSDVDPRQVAVGFLDVLGSLMINVFGLLLLVLVDGEIH